MEARRRGGSFHVDSADDNKGAENSRADSKPVIRSHNVEITVENDDTEASDNNTDGNLLFFLKLDF